MTVITDGVGTREGSGKAFRRKEGLNNETGAGRKSKAASADYR